MQVLTINTLLWFMPHMWALRGERRLLNRGEKSRWCIPESDQHLVYSCRTTKQLSIFSTEGRGQEEVLSVHHASESSLFRTGVLCGVFCGLLGDAALWPWTGSGANTRGHGPELRMLPLPAAVHAPHLCAWVSWEPLPDLLQTAETWNPAGACCFCRTLRQLHHRHVCSGLHHWQTGFCLSSISGTGSRYYPLLAVPLRAAARPHLKTGGALCPVGAHSSSGILLPGVELCSLPPGQWHSGLAGFLQLFLFPDSAFEADAHRAHHCCILWDPHLGSGRHHRTAAAGEHPGGSTWPTGKLEERKGGGVEGWVVLKCTFLVISFLCNLLSTYGVDFWHKIIFIDAAGWKPTTAVPRGQSFQT